MQAGVTRCRRSPSGSAQNTQRERPGARRVDDDPGRHRLDPRGSRAASAERKGGDGRPPIAFLQSVSEGEWLEAIPSIDRVGRSLIHASCVLEAGAKTAARVLATIAVHQLPNELRLLRDSVRVPPWAEASAAKQPTAHSPLGLRALVRPPARETPASPWRKQKSGPRPTRRSQVVQGCATNVEGGCM